MIKKRVIAGALACIVLAGAAFSGCKGKEDPNLVKVASLEKTLDLKNYKLTFEDNFDGTSFNTQYWRYGYTEEGPRKGGYWVDDAVKVRDGNLVITTNYRENGKFGAGWYTGALETSHQTYGDKDSGKMSDKGFSQKYGYFEVRCKVPKIHGAWAAFWLMPDNNFKNDVFGSGSDGAEIDIFESMYMYQKKEPYQNSVTHAVHIDGYGNELKSQGSKHYSMDDLYDTYHTYGLEWNENHYVFYIDGKETWRTNEWVSKDYPTYRMSNVAQVAEYIILSCEVAGVEKDGKPQPGKNADGGVNWAGTPEDNEDKSKSYDFLVDYVKVYQKNA